MFSPLPAYAAWRFVAAVDGFEVLYTAPGSLRGHTSAVEDGQPYAVRYAIELDEQWRTRRARVSADTLGGPREVDVASDGGGHWTVDGVPAPHLDGLADVDLEASACTNTLPVHRLALPPGEVTPASAVYVRDSPTRRSRTSPPSSPTTTAASSSTTPASRSGSPRLTVSSYISAHCYASPRARHGRARRPRPPADPRAPRRR